MLHKGRVKSKLSGSKIYIHNIRVISISVFIQNAEEVIAGYDPAFTLCQIIPQEREESLIAYSLTYSLQKVCAVEIDNVLVGVVVLTVIYGDIYVSARLEEINAV